MLVVISTAPNDQSKHRAIGRVSSFTLDALSGIECYTRKWEHYYGMWYVSFRISYGQRPG